VPEPTIPLLEQIKEVERELALREAVYKKRPPKNAAQHLENMRAVHRTLRWMAGQNVNPGAARPADLVAALAHIRLNLRGSQPGSKGEAFTKIIDDVLLGIQVPLLQELAIAADRVLNPPTDEGK